jgi:glycosyltransferase involved in cell wall biosynthesis
VVVRGHVEDLEAELATCRLTVAPLRFGAGIKGKIVSSLAAGVPCVASPVAVEGMGLADGLHLRVADGAAAFADAIVELHEQEAAWTALSDAGLEVARETFSVAGARRRIVAMLRELDLPAAGQGSDGTS